MEHHRPEENEAADAMVCIDVATAQKSEAVKLCGAQLRKRPGEFCRKPVMVGATRCERHGAKSRKGSEHPRWKSGAFSKYLPRDLRKRYEAWLSDSELLAARNEVAMLKSRLQELAGRLSTGETADAWLKLRDQLAKARAACDERDIDKVKAALAPATETVNAANANEAAWEAFTQLAERATLVAQREARRVLEGKMYATAEQVRWLVSSITNAVLANVRDSGERAAIANAIDRLRVLGREELDGMAAGTLEPDHGNSAAGKVT